MKKYRKNSTGSNAAVPALTRGTNEEGVALIAVMSLMVLVALLAASIATLSVITNQVSKVTCDMEGSVYRAEGAAERTIWLLMNDRIKFRSRTLGEYDYNNADEDEVERYMADGSEHKLDYYEGVAEVRIYDAAAGKDISGNTPDRRLHLPPEYFMDAPDEGERYNNFLAALKDYVDANDFVAPVGGIESDGYSELGLEPLPRNSSMEYREEMLWIPGADEFFQPENGLMKVFRIIAPAGLSQIRGRENFFSADKTSLEQNGRLSSEEYQDVLEAKRLWEKEQVPLTDTLNPELLSKVKSSYSMRESGFYTIVVEASPGEGLPGKTLTCTLQISNNLVTGEALKMYEWRFLK